MTPLAANNNNSNSIDENSKVQEKVIITDEDDFAPTIEPKGLSKKALYSIPNIFNCIIAHIHIIFLIYSYTHYSPIPYRGR